MLTPCLLLLPVPTGFFLDFDTLAEINQFTFNHKSEATTASLAVVLQRRGVAGVSAPKLVSALQHIVELTDEIEDLTDDTADVFVAAVEAAAAAQAAEGGAEAAQQAAAAKEGALQIISVGADGVDDAAEWFGVLCVAGAVIACGGPVLEAAEMQQLMQAVQQLGEQFEDLEGQLHGALVALADMSDEFFGAA
jgi:hypothetical protein